MKNNIGFDEWLDVVRENISRTEFNSNELAFLMNRYKQKCDPKKVWLN